MLALFVRKQFDCESTEYRLRVPLPLKSKQNFEVGQFDDLRDSLREEVCAVHEKCCPNVNSCLITRDMSYFDINKLLALSASIMRRFSTADNIMTPIALR